MRCWRWPAWGRKSPDTLVEFAKKYNVTVRVRPTFNDGPGTLVCKEDPCMESVMVSGIAYDRDQARVTLLDVTDRPGIAAAIFTPLAEAESWWT